MQSKTYRFYLDRSPKKFLCPACNKRRFVRYIDNETDDYLHDEIGKCDRENNCGHHYSPKEFFKANPKFLKGQEDDFIFKKPIKKMPPPKIDYLPKALIKDTLKHFESNNFVAYLKSLFSDDITADLIKRFNIGTSKHWKGATVFWQVDINGNARQAKVMLYNPETGKRKKENQEPDIGKGKVCFVGGRILKRRGIKEPNTKQCFFGEHQLKASCNKTVGIVESEKTAILMTVIKPEIVWLATGGKSGCGWTSLTVFKALKGRKVILFPDLGCYLDWSNKAELLRGVNYQVSVSALLEKKGTENDKRNGFDLADYFFKPKKGTVNWALTKEGYPMFWDYKGEIAEQPKEERKESQYIESQEERVLKGMINQNPAIETLIDQFELEPEKVELDD